MADTPFAGTDPFDALRGRNVPGWVRSRPRLRQAAIQIRKRLALPTSALYGVTPFVMAKTAGSLLTAAARLGDRTAMAAALAALDAAEGNLGDGAWGYEFDVQTRWAYYPAGSPNLIATVFVARGLATAGCAGGAVAGDAAGDGAADLARASASADFLCERLLEPSASPFFRYTLGSGRLVHNANLLGAGLVAMDGALTGRSDRIELALGCAQSSCTAQEGDGSWPYGEGAGLGWSDNFHTAYNLDGLLGVWLASGDAHVHAVLERGVAQWTRAFFGPAGEPYYYASKPYPYDIHSAGTAVDVASRLSRWGFETADLAERVAAWTRRTLVDPRTGATYYQRRRLWTDRREFVRWGDAHWALGRSSLELAQRGLTDPFEAAVASASGVVANEG